MSAPQHILCEDKSATFTGWAYTDSQTLKPWAYHPRPLGPKDVEIEITHGGCCGSDVHVICGRMVNPTIGPIIAGHEIIGKCNADQEQLCSKMTLVFNDYFKDERGGIPQGGFADRVRINGDFVHKVPSNISPAEAAPLFCAGLTTYSPLKNHGAGPNKTVGVIGIGVGCAMKCKEVVAISTSDNKRDEAFKLGATKFFQGPEQFKAAFHSIDILLVTGISKDVDWNELLSWSRTAAHLLLMREVNVTGSLIGGRRITAEMLEFASKHNPMSDINAAVQYMIDEAAAKI
ncbi:MAG: chaperonin 10-like protein [Podila humilis]|nr:MAG: chaperonin 10-like protein [Podila humilis]